MVEDHCVARRFLESKTDVVEDFMIDLRSSVARWSLEEDEVAEESKLQVFDQSIELSKGRIPARHLLLRTNRQVGVQGFFLRAPF